MKRTRNIWRVSALLALTGCESLQVAKPRDLDSATTTMEEPMRKVIDNVPTFQPEKDCGWMRFFGALTSVMRHQGKDVDYAYLMGVAESAGG